MEMTATANKETNTMKITWTPDRKMDKFAELLRESDDYTEVEYGIRPWWDETAETRILRAVRFVRYRTYTNYHGAEVAFTADEFVLATLDGKICTSQRFTGNAGSKKGRCRISFQAALEAAHEIRNTEKLIARLAEEAK